ncbi:MAG TPA: tetratricopeptide repeat protein [Ktedonobacterales bacterium]|jgi:hypothetical protein|nr:tetratricopeptide repeat protein [Ktedonobacterales bacterium]
MFDRGTDTQDATTVPRPFDAGREGQLRIARAMKNAGRIHQALHAFSRLMEHYPQDAESRAAMEELASLAADCEQRGQVYTALHLYQQLEQFG